MQNCCGALRFSSYFSLYHIAEDKKKKRETEIKKEIREGKSLQH